MAAVAIFDTTLLQRRGLGKRILALLQSKHPLPQAGIIAGQAVASAVDELFKLTPPVYNDIDVFLSGAQWQDQTGEDVVHYRTGYKSRIMASVNYRAEKFETVEAEYARIFLISDRMLYTVVKARADGLINRVWVSWSEFQTDVLAGPRIAARRAAGRAAALIAGFDLNCTQIAVDIQSGNLTYSKAFADYFATRQLAIVRTFTPIQSLLRYLKKRDELACYGNDEAHVELIRRLVLANELDPKFRDVRIDTFLKGRVKFSKAAAFEANRRSRAGVGSGAHAPHSVRRSAIAFSGHATTHRPHAWQWSARGV